MPEYLTLDQVADHIGVEVTTIRRAAKKIQGSTDLEIVRGKVPGRSQTALCVSDKHFQLLIAHFEEKRGETTLNTGHSDISAATGGYGFFYLIQLVPEALPKRIKVGYTDHLDNRLKEHQTAAPTARLVKSWRCKRAWDQAAMDSITSADCELILSEVYEGDLEKFIERGEQFFSIMPSPDSKPPLSKHSPLRTRENDT